MSGRGSHDPACLRLHLSEISLPCYISISISIYLTHLFKLRRWRGCHLLHALGDYFAECCASELRLRLLTSKSCLCVAAVGKELPSSAQVLLSGSSRYTVAVMGSTYLCTRWLAPAFALSGVLGRGKAKRQELEKLRVEQKELAHLMRELRLGSFRAERAMSEQELALLHMNSERF